MYPETYAFNIFVPRNTLTLMFKYILCKRRGCFILYIQSSQEFLQIKAAQPLKKLADLIFHNDRHENKPNEDNADAYNNIWA